VGHFLFGLFAADILLRANALYQIIRKETTLLLAAVPMPRII